MSLLQEPTLQEALIALVLKVLNNEDVRSGAQSLAIDVVRSKQVTEAATELGKSLVEDVVQDSMVQKKTGDGLYKAFIHSVTPSLFSRGNKATQELVDNGSTSNGTKNTIEPTERPTPDQD